MRLFQLLIVALLLLTGCASRSGPVVDPDRDEHTMTYTRYASGFRVDSQGTYSVVQVLDPWQQSKDVIFSYLLAPDREMLPDSLRNLPFIKTPVKRVIALSTTHVAMIDQLGSSASIVGLSGSDFIYNSSIRERIKSGAVKDVGYG
ncbi:MAG: hypothetical protein KAS82_03850, partial [Bacteroidales bacterium]|nr:hypothetical protein [Bacteroidales bacterium]